MFNKQLFTTLNILLVLVIVTTWSLPRYAADKDEEYDENEKELIDEDRKINF